MPTHRATRDTWDQVLARITRNGERVVAVVSPEAGVYDVLTSDVPRVESRGVSDGYVKGDRTLRYAGRIEDAAPESGFGGNLWVDPDLLGGVRTPAPTRPDPGVTERRP